MTRNFRCDLAEPAQLPGILALQARNLESALDPEEARRQGFVTVRHDLPLLRAMNERARQVIALAGDEVVAYALVMLREFRDRIPVLGPMFDQLDRLDLAPVRGDERAFFVMGQICVGREFRGSGAFGALYETMREHYHDRYRLVVTEIAARNTRSIRAHAKVGFETLREYTNDKGEDWVIVGWHWPAAGAS